MSATAVAVLEAETEAGGRGLSRGETEARRSCLYSSLCMLPTLILTYLPEREECVPPKISRVWCLGPAVPAPERSPLGHRTLGVSPHFLKALLLVPCLLPQAHHLHPQVSFPQDCTPTVCVSRPPSLCSLAFTSGLSLWWVPQGFWVCRSVLGCSGELVLRHWWAECIFQRWTQESFPLHVPLWSVLDKTVTTVTSKHRGTSISEAGSEKCHMSTLLPWATLRTQMPPCEGSKSRPERLDITMAAGIPVEISAARHVSDTPLDDPSLQLPSHPLHTFSAAPALFQLSVHRIGQFLL